MGLRLGLKVKGTVWDRDHIGDEATLLREGDIELTAKDALWRDKLKGGREGT